jgi:hypothetical protein
LVDHNSSRPTICGGRQSDNPDLRGVGARLAIQPGNIQESGGEIDCEETVLKLSFRGSGGEGQAGHIVIERCNRFGDFDYSRNV